jgi:ATP-dependent Clp protease adaptor protein ClpS
VSVSPEARAAAATGAAAPAPTEAPAEAPAERARSLAELLPPHAVVLHNDDVNEMGHVVRALLASVPELEVERATEVMLAAHLRGHAEVIRCPLERAELYRDRLRAQGLNATVEA